MTAVCEDLELSPLPEPEKALLRFVRKVNEDASGIEQADLEGLRQVGWAAKAIYDAIAVCSLFNFYNRWVDAHGIEALSEEAHRQRAKHMAAGYRRSP